MSPDQPRNVLPGNVPKSGPEVSYCHPAGDFGNHVISREMPFSFGESKLLNFEGETRERNFMDEKGFLPEKSRSGTCKVVAAVTLVVAAAVAVAVTVPTLLCHRGGDRNSTESLEKALDVTNRSLSLSLGRWQRCKEELGELQGKVSELEQALANVTRLEEQNRALGTEVTRLREQLGEEQNLRAQLQRQNRLMQDELRDVRSAQRDTGDKPVVSPGVLKLLLLLTMLLV